MAKVPLSSNARKYVKRAQDQRDRDILARKIRRGRESERKYGKSRSLVETGESKEGKSSGIGKVLGTKYLEGKAFSRGRGQENNPGKEKYSGFGLKIVFVIAIFFALFFFIILPSYESGSLEAGVGSLSSISQGLGQGIRPISNIWKNFYGQYVLGEYSFDLQGGVQENKRAGLGFGDFDISGVEFGGLGLGNNLRVDTSILVGKFDSEIDEIKAKVSCILRPENLTGNVKSDVVKENGEIVLDNPGDEDEYEQKGVKCYFSNENINLPKPVNSKEIEMMLSYSLSPSFSLDVFGMIDDLTPNEEKRIRNGEYDRVSKMRYVTDVDATLQFSDQKPLLVGGTKTLAIQFKNNNVRRNKVVLENFIIEFPKDMEVEECGVLEHISVADAWQMRKKSLDRISTGLNSESGKSDVFECVVRAPKELGSVDGIVPLGKIEGRIKFTNSLSKKQSVTIYKKEVPNGNLENSGVEENLET